MMAALLSLGVLGADVGGLGDLGTLLGVSGFGANAFLMRSVMSPLMLLHSDSQSVTQSSTS